VGKRTESSKPNQQKQSKTSREKGTEKQLQPKNQLTGKRNN
jgi:hypothetical protein